MSELGCEYRFTIDAFTPDSLPMSRLAEYMAGLAHLLGEAECVHFVRLEGGSTTVVHTVEPEAVPQVRKRVQSITCDDLPSDVGAAFKKLNRLLAMDNATGSLKDTASDLAIEFPGRDHQELVTYGVLSQLGVLDGQLIRIGGRDEDVPVHLRDGDLIHICNTDREIARQLGGHLYGGTLRVRGIGRWERDADGVWSLRPNFRGAIYGFPRVLQGHTEAVSPLGRVTWITAADIFPMRSDHDFAHEKHASGD